jgi:diadenosine tetraphosphate (Ap4A) HIT family hydrolase
VIEHPRPQARLHYLVIPKRDIKNIAELSDSDNEYLIDAFKVAREIIKENNLTDYRLTTNGPGYQGVTYLHFHLTPPINRNTTEAKLPCKNALTPNKVRTGSGSDRIPPAIPLTH